MGSQGLPYGFQAMLKEGHKHLVGLDEAVMKNIEACKQLASIIKTSMGPNGACLTLRVHFPSPEMVLSSKLTATL